MMKRLTALLLTALMALAPALAEGGAILAEGGASILDGR